jgi:hypothetical protein
VVPVTERIATHEARATLAARRLVDVNIVLHGGSLYIRSWVFAIPMSHPDDAAGPEVVPLVMQGDRLLARTAHPHGSPVDRLTASWTAFCPTLCQESFPRESQVSNSRLWKTTSISWCTVRTSTISTEKAHLSTVPPGRNRVYGFQAFRLCFCPPSKEPTTTAAETCSVRPFAKSSRKKPFTRSCAQSGH